MLTGYEQIATALIELGLFPLVLDMLLLPHSCNMLHMRAASILGEAAGELLTRVTTRDLLTRPLSTTLRMKILDL